MAAEILGICLDSSSGNEDKSSQYSGEYKYNVLVAKSAAAWQARTVLFESDEAQMSQDVPAREGVPSVWSTLDIGADVDSDIYILNKQARYLGEDSQGNYKWVVTCQAGGLGQANVNPGDLDPDPTKRTVRWSPTFETYSDLFEEELEIYEVGDSLRKVTNAAKDPFVPSPTVTRQRRVWVFEYAVATASEVDNLFTSFGGRINSITWTTPLGLPNPAPKTALCRRVKAGALTNENGFSYYPVELVIAIKGADEPNPEWTGIYLNQGPRFIDQNDGNKKKEWRDADGFTSGSMVNLDQNGHPLADDLEPIYWPTAKGFMKYKTANFNSLTFPVLP